MIYPGWFRQQNTGAIHRRSMTHCRQNVVLFFMVLCSIHRSIGGDRTHSEEANRAEEAVPSTQFVGLSTASAGGNRLAGATPNTLHSRPPSINFQSGPTMRDRSANLEPCHFKMLQITVQEVQNPVDGHSNSNPLKCLPSARILGYIHRTRT